MSAPTANVDACITNAAGTVVPRPSCSPSPGRGGFVSDHAGSNSAEFVSVVGLYRCELYPARHDRIRPPPVRPDPPRHLLDRPATLVPQPVAHECCRPAACEARHRNTLSNRDPLCSFAAIAWPRGTSLNPIGISADPKVCLSASSTSTPVSTSSLAGTAVIGRPLAEDAVQARSVSPPTRAPCHSLRQTERHRSVRNGERHGDRWTQQHECDDPR